jgi:glutathione-regulated potassium-efflux system ancillary protein KefF
MRWLPPLVLHGAHLVDEPTLAAHARSLRQRLASYPDWPEMAGLARAACDVPADARPAGLSRAPNHGTRTLPG